MDKKFEFWYGNKKLVYLSVSLLSITMPILLPVFQSVLVGAWVSGIIATYLLVVIFSPIWVMILTDRRGYSAFYQDYVEIRLDEDVHEIKYVDIRDVSMNVKRWSSWNIVTINSTLVIPISIRPKQSKILENFMNALSMRIQKTDCTQQFRDS